MTNDHFVEQLKLAVRSKTFYIMGCFGAPMTDTNKKRYTHNHTYNEKQANKINALSSDTFGFDCVCLLKGILWGWNADVNAIYGGAQYASNNVPDIGADAFAAQCPDLTNDWSKVLDIGEILWMNGHVGAYIGEGLAIECTPAWSHNVLITAVGNLGRVDGYNTRKWTKHGHSPYVDYVQPTYVYPTAKCKPSLYILQKGNKGESVKSLQAMLNRYGAKLAVDGFFGSATYESLCNYQREHALDVDGIAGVKTWDKLING